MKSKSIGSFFVVLTLVAGMIAITPSAFADHAKVDVSAPAGTATPGCEETNSCFIPAEAIVDVGGEVTWTNDDTAAHTATSGNPTDGPDGVFDSSLFGPGKTFTHKFEEAGTFNYFCMVHPWMLGVVTVQGETIEEEGEMMEEEETYASAMSSDGSVNVDIE
ncbi:MAG: cupredoxin domain-containing protein [Nitrosopumilaceae archaeon]